MPPALLELRGISRDYPSGEGVLTVLDRIDLDIHAGEMVAIVGVSGSGKSTLMNIIGCLDMPTRGSYRVDGRDVSTLSPDELAELRREHFGFIFQRYHLLADLPASGNVEVPAVYAGSARDARRGRAMALLQRLGLGDRGNHRPGQLSGGQQQRVSIARALMNGGDVILADEPTGALDTRSGEEVMAILSELNREGHTIILVTHEPDVAKHARRIIEIRDGAIVTDRVNAAEPERGPKAAADASRVPHSASHLRDRIVEAFRMAWMSMVSHKLRTFLTMLGIIIGIASVVSVVALATGSTQQILSDISSLGTNTVDIYPGKDFGDTRSGRVRTLRADDAVALSGEVYVDSVSPTMSTQLTLRYGNTSANAQVSGVGAQYFRAKGVEIARGSLFDDAAVRGMEQTVVIDDNTRKQFFGEDQDPIGRIVLLGNVPCRVIGVTQPGNSRFGGGSNLNVFVPYTTAMYRIMGRDDLGGITVRVADATPVPVAEAAIARFLTLRHGTKDFFTSNIDDIRKTVEQTTRVMTLLIASIALISLIVGGIGVMNIMLVSVTERTREIGVRMAVGARQSDILQQFLIEAVVVCLIGGLLGVLLAVSVSVLFNLAGSGFSMVISASSIVAAFACSTVVGVVFGFLPARNAARLNPVEALARE